MLLVPQTLVRGISSQTGFLAYGTAMQPMGVYKAAWTILINGGSNSTQALASRGGATYTMSDGLMPVEGSYSTNFLGFGTSFTRSFFHGSLSDFRLYERALSTASMQAIFQGSECCRLVSSGTFVDTSSMCSGSGNFNTEFCRACKSDCGPFHFIDNEDNACNGRRNQV